LLSIGYTNADDVTNVFTSCCVLHNWLLAVDGHDSIGELDGDWLEKDIEDNDSRCNRGTVVRAGDMEWTVSAHTDSSLVGSQGTLEEATEQDTSFDGFRADLMTHFQHASMHGRRGWLAHAADCR
jgi:hypothetical protein